MGEILPYIRHLFKTYTAFWRTLLQSSMLLQPNWHCNYCYFVVFCCLQKVIPSFSQGHCCRMVGNMVRPIDSMIAGPGSHFSSCERSSFIRSNTVWNIVTANKAVYKFTDGGFRACSIIYVLWGARLDARDLCIVDKYSAYWTASSDLHGWILLVKWDTVILEMVLWQFIT